VAEPPPTVTTISTPVSGDDLRALVADFDLRKLSAAFLDDPYPTYRALRESDAVHRLPDGSYFLSRYDDCLAVYRDAETWRSDKTVDFRPNFGDSLLYEHHTTSLVFNDPPYHTRVRKLLAPAFTPRALRALRPRIEALVEQGDMLGIPQDERAPLRGWSLAILGALEPVLSREQFEGGVAAVAEFKNYLNHIISRRLRDAAHDPAEILSTLIGASAFAGESAQGEQLSKLELIHNCIFLLNAGHETTTNLIGNAVDLLIRHPQAMHDLRGHPEAIETAVEEFLRMESSNQLGNRRAGNDTMLGSVAVAAGSYVHIGIGAANRDPAHFPEPDRLDIRREPNRHLAFGTGIHACAGMSLARMEAQVAIGRLLARFARIEPAGTPLRGNRARFRGFKAYPVSLS